MVQDGINKYKRPHNKKLTTYRKRNKVHNNRTMGSNLGRTRQKSTIDRVPEDKINSAYHMKNQKDLVKYLHTSACIPVKSTWIKATQKGYLQ